MKKILVADDNPDIVFSVVSGLKSMSSKFEFVTTTEGEEVLNIIQSHKIDLILLDIMMQPVDGLDLAAKIKSEPKFEDMPIIFLTAKMDDLTQQTAALTSEDYILKPFNVIDLHRRINRVLKL